MTQAIYMCGKSTSVAYKVWVMMCGESKHWYHFSLYREKEKEHKKQLYCCDINLFFGRVLQNIAVPKIGVWKEDL